jgi:hypothetical protein
MGEQQLKFLVVADVFLPGKFQYERVVLCRKFPKSVLRAHARKASQARYSVLKACIGSSRDARHAGSRQASPATTSSVPLTATKTAGSSARVS